MFDRGAITIDLKDKKVIHVDVKNSIHLSTLVIKHPIEEEFIQYHNKHLFKGIVEDTLLIKGQTEKKDINYGKVVTVRDADGDCYEYQLENIHNKHLLAGIEKKLLSASLNEEIEFKGYKYEVIDIQ